MAVFEERENPLDLQLHAGVKTNELKNELIVQMDLWLHSFIIFNPTRVFFRRESIESKLSGQLISSEIYVSLCVYWIRIDRF